MRYRNESFDVEYVDRNRDRDRIRARLNATFRVNDTITGQIGFSTGADDPRSGNQTLDGQNSRKPFALDVAYVTWAPNAKWKVTAGKQRYPWTRSPSLFYDNDVSPEGLAVNYTQGNFFAGAFYDWLAERALSFSNVTATTNTDSIMFGGQVGYRIPFSDSVRLTVAGTYFDFDGVEGYNPLFGGSSFGNTTVVGANNGCSRTLAAGTACLASDFNVAEVFADLTATVGGQPLRFFVDYAKNLEAEVNPVAQEEARHRVLGRRQLRRRVGGEGHLGSSACCISRSRRTRCSVSCSTPTSATATPTRRASSFAAATRSRATGRSTRRCSSTT